MTGLRISMSFEIFSAVMRVMLRSASFPASTAMSEPSASGEARTGFSSSKPSTFRPIYWISAGTGLS